MAGNLAGAAGASVPGPTGGAVLSITNSHTGDFTQGQQGATSTIIVSNDAGAGGQTSGPVTVTESAPSGLALQSMTGANWDCATTFGACTRSDPLSGGASYDPITVTVTVNTDASSPQVNQASVSGGGSASDTASDPTTILPADPLSGGASYDPITVTVNTDASSPQVNQASVSGGGSASDTASDPTTILGVQSITFTSTAPAGLVGGPAYTVTATGGPSGNPVVFTIDTSSTSGCTIAGSKVSIGGPEGTCTIDANQAGSGGDAPAPQVQQSFVVTLTR